MIETSTTSLGLSPSIRTESVEQMSSVDSAEPQAIGFGAVLGEMMTSAADAVRAGEAKAIAGLTGQVSAQAAIDAVMAAERTLQTGIAIRDKVVSAYLGITRMQI